MEPPLSVCQRLLKAVEEDETDEGHGVPWRVLSSDQRASLRERGFVVVDGLAPPDLAAEAYEEVREVARNRLTKVKSSDPVTNFRRRSDD